MKRFQALIIIALIVSNGCSTAPQQNEHTLHNILLYNLHIRRTEYPGANPSATFGDEDYFSSTRPNQRLDCVPIQSLFSHLQFESLKSCFENIGQSQESVTVIYRLKKDNAPYLELKTPEKAPVCLLQHLPKIPVPREIFFQSREEGTLNCYNSRIPVRSDEWLGIGTFLNRIEVPIQFPLEKMPKNQNELMMLLTTWSIGPFWRESDRDIVSKIVPTELCRKCIGDEKLFLETDNLPPHWP